MIKNIGSVLDKIEVYLSSNVNLTSVFTGGISAGKPVGTVENKSLYFSLEGNSPLISTSRKDGGILHKRAIFDFVIIANKKNTPDVELYEALDVISNQICGKEIMLDTFKILSIKEGNQSGIIHDENENPLIIAQYEFLYDSKY